MNRGLYTAASGMYMGQQWLDVVSNNLANANTTGFRRDEISFGDTFAEKVRSGAGGGPIIGTLYSGPQAMGTQTVMTRGAIQMTGNSYDLAIDSTEGMFAVQTPAGVRFTRDGSFTLDVEGRLVTKTGFAVLATDGRPIQLGNTKPEFSAEGAIKDAEGETRQIAIMNGSFQKQGDNVFVANGEVTNVANARVVAGAIESSNVDTIKAMVEMIQIQRIYEMAQRSVQQQDEASQLLIQRVSGN